MKKLMPILFLFALVVFGFCDVGLSGGGSASPLLFTPDSSLKATTSGEILGRIDLDVLKSLSEGDRAFVDFGWGPVLLVTVRNEVRSEGVKWFGRPVNAEPGDLVLFTIVEGKIACTARVGARSISCNPSDKDGIAYIVDTTDAIEPSFFQSFFDTVMPPGNGGESQITASQQALQSAADGSITVDVIALYTPGLKEAYGGVSALRAKLQNLFDYANVIHSNSRTNVTLRMGDMREVNTDDDSDMNSVLEDMYEGLNEFSNLPLWMDQSGADIAVLFRKYTPFDSSCGRGYMPDNIIFFTDPHYSKKVFRSVVEVGEYREGNTRYFCPDESLAHETGHNFGCNHDRNHASPGGMYPFSYGYCGSDYGTVMSYCYPRVPHFSDDRIVEGRIIGDVNSRNAETIRLTAGYVASVRSAGGSVYNEYKLRLEQVYVAYYGRPADPGGLDYWADRLEREGGDLRAIIEAFGRSEEFSRRYGNLTNEQLIDKIYQQMFNRYPDPDGKSFYLSKLNSGVMSLQTITLNVLDGAIGDDKQIIDNKVEVAIYFTEKVRRGCPYSSEEVGISFVSGVDSTVASVISAKESIDEYCSR